MKCTVCGGKLEPVATDLPFKLSQNSIVVVKNLPVLQCSNCTEFLIEDPVYARVEKLMDSVNEAVELEIIQYAA